MLKHSDLEDEASPERRMRSGAQTVEKEVDRLKEGEQYLTVAGPVGAVHELNQLCFTLPNRPGNVCDGAKSTCV